MAAANFASIQKHNFQFMHCREILKDEPKWQDPKPRPNARSAESEGFGEETHHGADNEDTEDFSPPRAAARRPMGRDSAKAAKKTANSSAGSAASVEYAARKQDIRESRLSILQDETVAKKTISSNKAPTTCHYYRLSKRRCSCCVRSMRWTRYRRREKKRKEFLPLTSANVFHLSSCTIKCFRKRLS
jgi:hypothetical protein